MKRRDKKKKDRLENVPEIFKVLWDLNSVKWKCNFIKSIGFSRIENEMWPKIRIAIAYEDENKAEMIKALLRKYEVPSNNTEIVLDRDKKEQGDRKEKPAMNTKSAFSGNRPKPTFKVSGSSFPLFKAR